jgi:PKD repeat protein
MSIIQNVLFGKSAGITPAILPVANFSASATSITQSNSINFTDTSTVAPGGQAITSWTWSFEGGTPTSSNAQNPTITYNQTGSFNVSLTVANPSGSDTETKTNYIFVTASAVLPFSATGGSVSTVGSYTVHTFTSTGVFSVTGSRELDVFLVGGGANGANGVQGTNAGGGGNGASVLTTSMSFSTNAYTIRVGSVGNLSSVEQPASTILLQAAGGSGTGASSANSLADGGDGATGNNSGGNGGAGVTNNWLGSNVGYAGGGGGGNAAAGQPPGDGTDGGGTGGYNIFPTNFPATAARTNSGAGGGGGYKFNPTAGGAGGTGIVIIRYLTNP